MVQGTLTPPQNTAESTDMLVEFPENRLLIDLCGEHDRNLAAIEQSLSVQINRRGNQLWILGDEATQIRASDVLEALYSRLESGRGIEPGDIDRELRMDVVRSGGQQEKNPVGKVEIKTRKKLVEPRTEAQNAYVQSLFANELVFGIGPAGTGKTYLAVAVGVSMFLNGKVDKIILSRPAVEAANALAFCPVT